MHVPPFVLGYHIWGGLVQFLGGHRGWGSACNSPHPPCAPRLCEVLVVSRGDWAMRAGGGCWACVVCCAWSAFLGRGVACGASDPGHLQPNAQPHPPSGLLLPPRHHWGCVGGDPHRPPPPSGPHPHDHWGCVGGDPHRPPTLHSPPMTTGGVCGGGGPSTIAPYRRWRKARRTGHSGS